MIRLNTLKAIEFLEESEKQPDIIPENCLFKFSITKLDYLFNFSEIENFSVKKCAEQFIKNY